MVCDHCGAQIADGLAHDVFARCDNCQRPLRSQVPNTAPEGRLRDMPDAGAQPDMGGNPLREGIMADNGWAHPSKRDEYFASADFEVADVLPPDASSIEAAHTATIRTPNGITDNLHTALDKTKAWVENPYENGRLCPYYKGYWKSIRPALGRGSSLRIGVSDPQMAEIINHVAQTDDLGPIGQLGVKEASLWGAVKSIGQAALPAGIMAGALALAPETGGASLAGGAALEGAALGGGEAAAAGGGAAGLGGLMRGAMGAGKGLMKKLGPGMMAEHALQDIGGGGGGGMAQAPGGGGGAVVDPSYYSRLNEGFPFLYAGDDYDSPTSNQGYVDTDDPEKVDQKERNDGDHSQWQKDNTDNDIGGSQHPFEPVADQIAHALPKILHYFTSEESGEHDPELQGLHQALESILPGYQDQDGPEHTHNFLMMMAQPDHPDHLHKAAMPMPMPMQVPPPSTSGAGWTDGAPQGVLPGQCPACHGTITPGQARCSQCGSGVEHAPGQQFAQPPVAGADAVNPAAGQNVQAARDGVFFGPAHPEEEGLQSTAWPTRSDYEQCPSCKSFTQMQLGGCPQCGTQVYNNGNDQTNHRQAADAQGPHTPEQISAVTALLIQQGRIDEVPLVAIQPENYADELAQIQQRDTPPNDLDADPQQNQPQPAIEQTPPDAGMPVPPMSAPQGQQMAMAAFKYGADSIADTCPKCKSHTTAVLDIDEGHSKCHTCGHHFKTNFMPNDTHSTDTAHSAGIEDSDLNDHHPNHADVSAADFEHPENVENEQDTGHTWQDQNGEPLKVGREYEMHSAQYDIPEIIRIETVKPDSISYTITGQYGLNHSTEVTHEEALLESLTFAPAEQHPDDQSLGIEENMDDVNRPQPGQQTDLSSPHMALSSVEPAHGDPALDWLRPHTAGARFTPMEQRDFIDEQGKARNADRLDLSNTHYVISDDEPSSFLW